MAFLKDLILPASETWVISCFMALGSDGKHHHDDAFNMHFSYKAMGLSRVIIDEEYTRYTKGNVTTSDFWETARTRQKQVPYNKWIQWINTSAFARLR